MVVFKTVRLLLSILVISVAAMAQTNVFPLSEIRRGLTGEGRTVFEGDKVEPFSVEVLGVLENVGPKQSLILARLSGGPLEKTGVLQGMSGSPVYFEGRLAGAVAIAFPFSKEAIAGIRPIEEMLRVPEELSGPKRKASINLLDRSLTEVFAPSPQYLAGGMALRDIATPLSFGGFTTRTIETFAPQLRALGLEPAQGISAGAGGSTKAKADAKPLEPGSMITVHLLKGDMNVGADGTVTHIDGDRVYAFGHRFLSLGNTSLPFSRAEVMALLPNLTVSFKISAAQELLGVIETDRSAAIAGRLGGSARLTPVSLAVVRRDENGKTTLENQYDLQMVRDSLLSPVLLQMAIFSAIDATEQSVGRATYHLTGSIEFEGVAKPVRVDSMYANDFNATAQTALAASLPMAYALQSGFEELEPKAVNLRLEALRGSRQLRVMQVWPNRQEAAPGETIDLNILLASEDGQEHTQKASWKVPDGAVPGPVQFTVGDGSAMNMLDIRRYAGSQPRSPEQLVDLVNDLKPNHQLFIRVWRPTPSYLVEGQEMPSLPASVSLLMASDQAANGGMSTSYTSRLDEFAIDLGDRAVSGSQTIKVEIKD